MKRSSIVQSALLMLAIFASWAALHVYGVFFYRPEDGLIIAPLLVAVICWLDVGLFIVAHDAMHGSLFPGWRSANLCFGRIALALYAGFRFDKLRKAHMAHHSGPGRAEDPDFSMDHATRFWPWYVTFMRRYFGWTEFAVLCVAVAIYLLIGARISNLLLFWALPAILSSLQLFYFGTFLPHRHASQPFADRHNARSNEFGWFLSLLTCFHFGYHHEHHLAPQVPWWGLPAERRRRAFARSDPQPAKHHPRL